MNELTQPRVLREYALIADGERGAMIGPDGTIDWLCVPRWDSPAAFAQLLGGPGHYTVTPADRWYVWGGYYENGSLIWHSRWTGGGVTECREALAMPADPGRCVIMRRIEAVEGPAKVRVELDIAAGFGRDEMRDLKRSGGVWSGRSGRIRFRWTGAAKASQSDDGALSLVISLPEGGHHDLVLELADQVLDDEPPDPEGLWQATRDAWSRVVPDCAGLIAVRDARHAYAVLRGLTSSTGAMVAAATTSLPERMEGGRNYDYRFAWIRDQCYSGMAIAAHGEHPLLDGTVRFLTERVLEDGSDLEPAYTITGQKIPGERTLPLRGYPGGIAVAGNRVRSQFQLDCLGEVLNVLAAAARLDRLTGENWRAVETVVAAIGQRWEKADAGLWEIDDERWAHSRLTCVAGLRSIAAVASGSPGGYGYRQAARWSALADEILASLPDCVHEEGRWQRSPGDERTDASLLLPMIRGAVPVDDPRSLATLRAVREQLADDGYLYRFRHDSRPLHKSEGAFLLCGFWMAQALAMRGESAEAARWFERNRAACGPAGLYTEEYDVGQRQLRGNLPQAFVHAAMLECAAWLSAEASATDFAFEAPANPV
ncbi:MAG TPA: glycoside hydrolase family 15 protein [Streptosporangiaceae bacterium]|nr:glycoside hydrolase family 15 protein [Streptosporangiaceae bacterium]